MKHLKTHQQYRETKGLRKSACNTAPETASAPPNDAKQNAGAMDLRNRNNLSLIDLNMRSGQSQLLRPIPGR